MKFEEIMSELKSGTYRSVYLLGGEEAYYIDAITQYISTHALAESERDFNQTIVYGADSDVGSIVDRAKQYPMMSERQVVIVKEAQNLKQVDQLEGYMKNPVGSTILVLAYKNKKPDARKAWVKQAKKNGVFFESKKLYDNQVPQWVKSYLLNHGYSIEPRAMQLVADYLGADLNKITNELDKLMLNADRGEPITTDTVQENIGISKDFNFFELQKAIGQRNPLKAQQIAYHFAQNSKEHPLVVTLGILATFFSKTLCYYFTKDKSEKSLASVMKVSPFFVKDYLEAARNYPAPKIVANIALLREYDMKSKGVGNVSTSDGELLKELVFKLMN